MRIRETPMRVNRNTTALELLDYLGDLEEVLQKDGRVAAIPETALIQIKTEFFEIHEMLGRAIQREIPEVDGDLGGLVICVTRVEWIAFRTFVHHVGNVLSHFEEVGGELPGELPGGPER